MKLTLREARLLWLVLASLASILFFEGYTTASALALLPYVPMYLQTSRQTGSFGIALSFIPALDSITSEFIICSEAVVSTAAATAAIEGLGQMVNKVYINTNIPNYSGTTPINNVSGSQLMDAAQFIRRSVPYSYGSLGSTGPVGVYIPCTFIQERLPFKLRFNACLPLFTVSNCTVQVTLGQQATMDTNASPTLAFSTWTVYCQQNEYLANTIPPLAPPGPAANVPAQSFTFIGNQLSVVSQLNPQTGLQQQQFNNGTYWLMLIRAFSASTSGGRVATTRQAAGGLTGPIDATQTSLGIQLQDINGFARFNVTWGSMIKENEDNIYDGLVAGNAAFQMNRSLNEFFQPSGSNNQINLQYPVLLTGTTNPKIDFVYGQTFDTFNWLLLK